MSQGFTQLELSQKLEISLRTYQRIEYGEQKPNVHVVIKLQKLFQRSIDELIEQKPEKQDKESRR